MTTKHTPGPWRVARKVSNCVVARGGLDIIAQCDTIGEETRDTENANARLIAAAPDLLAALEFILVDQDSELDYETRLIVRAAIAQAKGE